MCSRGNYHLFFRVNVTIQDARRHLYSVCAHYFFFLFYFIIIGRGVRSQTGGPYYYNNIMLYKQQNNIITLALICGTSRVSIFQVYVLMRQLIYLRRMYILKKGLRLSNVLIYVLLLYNIILTKSVSSSSVCV